MIRTVLLTAALLCVVLFASQADARARTGHHHRHHFVDATKMVGCSDPVMRPCWPFNPAENYSEKYSRKRVSLGLRSMPPGLRRLMAEGAGRVVAHPAGCPWRAFCGCGAAVHIFGRPIRSLWLAANWLKFPRAEPAPGRAAVRPDGHHIVILRRQISGSTWLVYDANSGRHRTRVHPRSIAGWTIVDPRGA